MSSNDFVIHLPLVLHQPSLQRRLGEFLTQFRGRLSLIAPLKFLLLAVFLFSTGARAQEPLPERRKVEFEVLGTKVFGWLYMPSLSPTALAKPEKTLPAIVALHGCGGLYGSENRSKFQFNARHKQYAELLAYAGYVVLFPDSFESRGIASICSEKKRTITPANQRVSDSAAALRFLAEQPHVDAKRIGLLGWSNGGSTTLHTVSAQSRASNSKVFSPASGERFKAAIAFYPGCSGLVESGDFVSPMPLKLMLGSADNWTPAKPCEALGEQARAKGQAVEVRLFADAVHDFDAPGMRLRERTGLAYTADGTGRAWVGTHEPSRQQALAEVLEFFGKHLSP